MKESIRIEHQGRYIGSINLDETLEYSSINRIASGFNLLLPIVIDINLVPQDAPLPILSNIRGVIYAPLPSNQKVEVGRLTTTEISYQSTYETKSHLRWIGTFADLAFYEKLRAGGIVQFDIELSGELSFLIPGAHPQHMLRTEPHRLFDHKGSTTVVYQRERWIKLVQNLGIAQNILVEIPVPGRVPQSWEAIWKGLSDAREALDQGGSTAWKACGTGVRLALEAWHTIEKEDLGPGWKPPTMQERKDRTKEQRLDNLRWHLYEIAHLSAHTPAEEWARDDAILLIATCSALLAKRNP
jgi:hypothetical protein